MSAKPRRLRFDSLEPRIVLSAAPTGGAVLVNDLVAHVQSAEYASAAMAAVGDRQIAVFEGKGLNDATGIFAEVTGNSGTIVRASFRVNTTIRGEQHAPGLAAARDGSFVVTWAGRGAGDKAGVFFQRFDRDGVALGEETLANVTTGGLQGEPAIAVAVDGSITIVWSGTGAGDVSGVFLRRFDASGVAIGGETLVNTTTDDHQTSPSLALDTGGDLVVAWQSRHQDGSDWGVYAQRFDVLGTRIGGETQINVTTDQSQAAPDVAAAPDGGVVIAWQSREQDGDSWGVVARAFDTALMPANDEVVLNETTLGQQEKPWIAVAPDGQWLATWSSGQPDGSGWEAIARSFEADGTANAESFVSDAANGANSGHQRSSGLAINGDAAVLVWTGAGEMDHHGVYAQGAVFEIDNGAQQSPNIAPLGDRETATGELVEVVVTATDPNPLDTLTFLLDRDNSPADATLEPIGPYSARIVWTSPPSAAGQSFPFRVLVIDDGEPPLADSEDFIVMVAEANAEAADLSAADETFASFE